VAFVTIFLLGRVAGKQILVAGKNHLLVALINWSITMGILIVYVLGFSWLMRIVSDDWGRVFLMLALIIGSVWLLAVRAIKRSSARLPGSR
jgi:biotin transporter BioY